MTKVIGYVRVSTGKQAELGVSLDMQKAKIHAYAALYDLEVVGIIVDPGLSASSLEREGLQAALARLGQDAEALIVTKLDRLTRSVKDLGFLIERYFTKYALLCVGDQIDTRSAAGKLVLNVLVSVAQWEREVIAERTKAALDHKRSLGEYAGGSIPWGFSLEEGKLVVNNREVEATRIAGSLELQGMSLRKISKSLLDRGYHDRKGKQISPEMINRIVKIYHRSLSENAQTSR